MSSPPLNILHIIDTLGLGGAQTLLQGILLSEAAGARHHVFALRRREPQLALPADRCWVHASSSKWSLSPRAQLANLIRQIQPDILHCHLPRSELFGLLALQSGRPVRRIAHEHGQILGSDDGRRLPHLGYCAVKRVMARRFDLHIAVSHAVGAALTRYAGVAPERIATLHNFIDVARFAGGRDAALREARRRAWQIDFAAPLVGFAGRFVRRKGWREFLRAAKMLVEGGSPAMFVIAGNGLERERLVAEIRDLALAERVRYVGQERDMIGFYSAIDCFAMPSHFEGLPMAQLEAMAMEVPLVLADAPGNNEIARPGVDAVYVRAKDAVDLAKGIGTFLGDAHAAADRARSAKTRVADFSSGRYVAALENLYRRVLS